MAEDIFTCIVCSKAFQARKRYNQHLKIHSKPVHCEKCPRRFAQRFDLTRHHHARHRVGLSKTSCRVPGCDFKATRKDNLRQHNANMHGHQTTARASLDQSTVDTEQCEKYKDDHTSPDPEAPCNLVPPPSSTSIILAAADAGHIGLLERAWEAGVDLTMMRGGDTSTPLHCAARAGQSAAVRRLLEMGLSAESVNDKGRTPLHEAVLGQDLESIRLFLDSQHLIHIKDFRGRTPVDYMMQNANADYVSLLIDHLPGDLINQGRQSPLFLAAKYGDIQSAKVLLAHPSIDVKKRTDNSTDRLGGTALHAAARGGHDEMVRLLVAHRDTDINIRSDSTNCGITPLSLAAKGGHEEIVRILVAHRNTDINIRSYDTDVGPTPLSLAAEHGHEHIVRFLLTVEKTRVGNAFFCTAYQALSNGFPTIAALILKDSRHKFHSVTDSNTNDDFEMYLDLATRRNYTDVVKLLVDISNSGYDPWSRLGRAIIDGHCELVELFAKSTETRMQLRMGCSPVHKAAACGNIEVMKLLLKHKHLDPNWMIGCRETALHIALWDSRIEIAKLLLENDRVDVNLLCGWHWQAKRKTALDIALEKNKTEIIDMLLARGALLAIDLEAIAQGNVQDLLQPTINVPTIHAQESNQPPT